jgi:multidrug efflux pump subunit AcrB
LSVKKRLGHPWRRSENRIDQFSSTRMVWAVRQGGWDQVVVVVMVVVVVVVVLLLLLPGEAGHYLLPKADGVALRVERR